MTKKFTGYLLLLLSLFLMAQSGCDLGTYENRFDEHFEGRLDREQVSGPTIL